MSADQQFLKQALNQEGIEAGGSGCLPLLPSQPRLLRCGAGDRAVTEGLAWDTAQGEVRRRKAAGGWRGSVRLLPGSPPAAREAELRRLRKMNVAFEEQNAVLQRHTQSMSSARERLEQELALEERRTLALQQQLQAVRQALTANFASLPVPGTGETPTLSTLDFYMARLHGSMESDPALAREAHRPHQGDPGPGRQ